VGGERRRGIELSKVRGRKVKVGGFKKKEKKSISLGTDNKTTLRKEEKRSRGK